MIDKQVENKVYLILQAAAVHTLSIKVPGSHQIMLLAYLTGTSLFLGRQAYIESSSRFIFIYYNIVQSTYLYRHHWKPL